MVTVSWLQVRKTVRLLYAFIEQWRRYFPTWYTAREDDEEQERLRIVSTAAAIILEDVTSLVSAWVRGRADFRFHRCRLSTKGCLQKKLENFKFTIISEDVK